MYDSIIIGTGPAGLSAALNLKTYKKDFIWFGSKNLSEKVQKAEKITDRKSTRLNSSHTQKSRMPSSA